MYFLNIKVKHLGFLILATLMAPGGLLFAVINPEKAENPGQSKRVQVRIPISLVSYERLMIKKSDGTTQAIYKKAQKLNRNLRSRIERSNHFYTNKWHIETIPISWQKASKKYTTKLRLYKRYGEGDELEEYMGYATINGQLSGENNILELKGYATKSFTDKQGNPILDLEIGRSIPTQKSLISKETTDKQPIILR